MKLTSTTCHSKPKKGEKKYSCSNIVFVSRFDRSSDEKYTHKQSLTYITSGNWDDPVHFIEIFILVIFCSIVRYQCQIFLHM